MIDNVSDYFKELSPVASKEVVSDEIFEPNLNTPELIDLKKYLLEKGRTLSLKRGYENWLDNELRNQLYASPIALNYQGKDAFLVYGGVTFIVPTYTEDGKIYKLYPANAIRRKMDYLTTVVAQPIVIDQNGNELGRGKPRELFKVPTMVGTKYCNTYGLTRAQLQEIGENIDSPGGEFIYGGSQRVITGLDKMRLNQVFIHKSSKKIPYSNANQTFNVPSGTAVVRMIMKKIMKKTQVTALHLNVAKMVKQSGTDESDKIMNSVNIFHLVDIICYVYKRQDLLGNESEHVCQRRIMDFICPEDYSKRRIQREKVRNKLLGTIVENNEVNFTKAIGEILEWLSVINSPMSDRLKAIKELIEKNIFPTCNITLVSQKVVVVNEDGDEEEVEEQYYDGVERMIDMISYMAARFLLYQIGDEPFSDKNDWGSKRIDLAHVSLSNTFFWTEWDRACKSFYAETIKDKKEGSVVTSIDSFQNKLKLDKITSALLSVFNSKSDEGTVGSAFQQSQQISPANTHDLISLLTKFQSKTQKTDPSLGTRAVQASSFMKICPSENPEGGRCGLVRRFAMTTEVTIASDVLAVLELFMRYGLITEKREDTYPFILNELPRGWCTGRECYEKLMLMKKNAPWKFSIWLDQDEDEETSLEILKELEESSVPFDETDVHITLAYPEYRQIFHKKLSTLTGGFSEDLDEGLPPTYHYQLFVDEEFIGSCDNEFLRQLYTLSLFTGKLTPLCEQSCILFNHRGHIEVYVDQGRPVIPLYIVEDGEVYAEDRELTKNLSFSQMVDRGFICYVDAYEEADDSYVMATDIRSFHEKQAEHLKHVAMVKELREKYEEATTDKDRMILKRRIDYYEEAVSREVRYPIKYVGLHGVAIYGTTAGVAPLTGNQTAAKSSHAAKINKQALAANPLPYSHRKAITLATGGTNPITTPSIGALVGVRRMPTSVTAVTAFIDDPYNQEDAILMSSLMIETGKVSFIMSFSVKGEIEISGTKRLLGIPKVMRPGEKYLYRNLTSQGLPVIGSYLESGDACIGIIEKGEIEGNRTIFLKEKERGRVKDIIITSNKNTSGSSVTSYTVDVLLEDYRIPVVGDKFSINYGQKAVIGRIVKQEDMVFLSDAGYYISCEVIYNSHAINNRMTLGLIGEALVGSASAIQGITSDTTSFTNFSTEKAKQVLKQNGFSPIGTSSLYSGTSGVKMYGDIYLGPQNLQQLHHIASESMNAKATAKYNPVTRQVEKARKDGGQRSGEQERVIIIAHRAHHLFEEKYRIYSDNYVTAWCGACNLPSPVSSGICRYCGAVDKFLLVKMPYTYKRASEYAMTMGIRIYSVVVNEEDYAKNYISSMRKMNEKYEYNDDDGDENIEEEDQEQE